MPVSLLRFWSSNYFDDHCNKVKQLYLPKPMPKAKHFYKKYKYCNCIALHHKYNKHPWLYLFLFSCRLGSSRASYRHRTSSSYAVSYRGEGQSHYLLEERRAHPGVNQQDLSEPADPPDLQHSEGGLRCLSVLRIQGELGSSGHCSAPARRYDRLKALKKNL